MTRRRPSQRLTTVTELIAAAVRDWTDLKVRTMPDPGPQHVNGFLVTWYGKRYRVTVEAEQ